MSGLALLSLSLSGLQILPSYCKMGMLSLNLVEIELNENYKNTISKVTIIIQNRIPK